MKTDKNSRTTTAEGALLQPERAIPSSGFLRTAALLGTRQDSRFLQHHLGIRLTRGGLLTKGLHVDLTTLARMAGFKFHLFLRRRCYERLTQDTQPQDGDLDALLVSLRDALHEAEDFEQPLPFFANAVPLVAYCNRVDFDDPRPAVTVVLREELEGGQGHE